MTLPSRVAMMISRCEARPHELALRPQAHGDDPAPPHVPEFAEVGLLNLAVRGQHDDVLVFAEVLDGDDRGHRLPRLELEEVDDGFAPPRDADIGYLERLEPVDASGVC